LYCFLFAVANAAEEVSPAQSQNLQALQRCNFLFGQALDADERGLPDIAIDLYGQTVEFAISVVSNFVGLQLFKFYTYIIHMRTFILG